MVSFVVRADEKLTPFLELERVDQDDDCNYEQQMDQAAAKVADEAKKPEND